MLEYCDCMFSICAFVFDPQQSHHAYLILVIKRVSLREFIQLCIVMIVSQDFAISV